MSLDDQTMTVYETADFLKIHRNTVYKWLNEEKLGHIKIGNHYRIFKEDLDEFLLKMKNTEDEVIC